MCRECAYIKRKVLLIEEIGVALNVETFAQKLYITELIQFLFFIV